MKHILIGYDGSPCADAAMEGLSQAGLPAELNATVMSVADVWLPNNPAGPGPAFPDTLPRSLQAARERAVQAVESSKKLAEAAADKLRRLHPGWKVASEACADSPGWALITRADAMRADLVVVGSHGRGLLERIFLGSVSQRVAAEARCSVRIARSNRRANAERLRLLLAIDGSEDSRQVVESVLKRAWPKSTEVRLATVIDTRLESSLAWSNDFAREWVVEHDKGIREGVCRRLEEWSKKIAGAGLKVDTAIHEGEAKHELLKAAEAWEADTILLGARGLQHGGRLTLGTTVSGIAARAHCTVEIIRGT